MPRSGSSRVSRPSSRNRMTSTAVIVLVIEPMRYCRSASGHGCSPAAAKCSSAPSRTTPAPATAPARGLRAGRHVVDLSGGLGISARRLPSRSVRATDRSDRRFDGDSPETTGRRTVRGHVTIVTWSRLWIVLGSCSRSPRCSRRLRADHARGRRARRRGCGRARAHRCACRRWSSPSSPALALVARPAGDTTTPATSSSSGDDSPSASRRSRARRHRPGRGGRRAGMVKIDGELWTARAYDATQISRPVNGSGSSRSRAPPPSSGGTITIPVSYRRRK